MILILTRNLEAEKQALNLDRDSETAGLNQERDIEVRRAVQRAELARELLTTPYVFDPAEAVAMAKAGADILVCHFGLTVGGAIGATSSVRLEDCPALTDAMAQAALAINPDLFILVHGGPIAEPADAAYVLAHARHCDGFYGASSMERLPVERALVDQVAKFKALTKAQVLVQVQVENRPA